MARGFVMMRAALRADFDRIVDAVTCADGGAEFVRLRVMLETIDAQAARGDKAAAEVLTVVRRFARLIDAAQHAQSRKASEPDL